MKKENLVIAALFMFGVCNQAMAFTAELDPGTPLSSYVSLAEWDTPGDFEDWTTNTHIIDAAVSGGSITGQVSGVDPIINLAISALPGGDPRRSNIMITGSVYEIRMRFDAASLNTRIDMFPTINGAFQVPPLQFANNADGSLPDIPVDGAFHVYRITLDAADAVALLGQLDAVRFDGLADAGPIGETFEIDYFRIAHLGSNPLTVDGPLLASPTSIAEWNVDNDFEGWLFNGPQFSSSNVTGGVMSGVPTGGGDPWFYKSNAQGMPMVDLDNNGRYLEFRLRQVALGSQIEIFFGTTNNPGMSGARRIAIVSGDIPQDSAFHVYRYDMSTHADWNGFLELIRLDPYTIATTDPFEIDYVRVGSSIVPEPAFLLSVLLAGFVMFRKQS